MALRRWRRKWAMHFLAGEVIRLFHDEALVRAAALRAAREAVSSGAWRQESESLFEMPVDFHDFADFEQRMIGVTFADHRLDASTLQAVRTRFESHMTSDGANFLRPMRINLLRRRQTPVLKFQLD